MKIFLGVEFRDEKLITIGLVAEDGREFYADHYDRGRLVLWLWRFDRVVICSDNPNLDWKLFCDLFGGEFYIPENIQQVHFSLAYLLKELGIEPMQSPEHNSQHNALQEAKAIKTCFENHLKMGMPQ